MIRLERERRVRVNGAELWSAATGSGTPLLMFNGGPGCDDYLGPVAALLSARRAEAAEDQGGQTFHSDPEVNRVGNATFRAYCRRPSLLREIAELELPSVFINAELDIRPNWPTRQLAELIRGARYVEIVGAAHFVWLTHAAELGRELERAVSHILEIDERRQQMERG